MKRVSKPREIITRRYHVERDLQGGIERLYREVPGQKGGCQWRLVWTYKRSKRGHAPAWPEVERLIGAEGFVAAIDGQAARNGAALIEERRTNPIELTF
jgi:hypothetical protein